MKIKAKAALYIMIVVLIAASMSVLADSYNGASSSVLTMTGPREVLGTTNSVNGSTFSSYDYAYNELFAKYAAPGIYLSTQCTMYYTSGNYLYTAFGSTGPVYCGEDKDWRNPIFAYARANTYDGQSALGTHTAQGITSTTFTTSVSF